MPTAREIIEAAKAKAGAAWPSGTRPESMAEETERLAREAEYRVNASPDAREAFDQAHDKAHAKKPK